MNFATEKLQHPTISCCANVNIAFKTAYRCGDLNTAIWCMHNFELKVITGRFLQAIICSNNTEFIRKILPKCEFNEFGKLKNFCKYVNDQILILLVENFRHNINFSDLLKLFLEMSKLNRIYIMTYILDAYPIIVDIHGHEMFVGVCTYGHLEIAQKLYASINSKPDIRKIIYNVCGYNCQKDMLEWLYNLDSQIDFSKLLKKLSSDPSTDTLEWICNKADFDKEHYTYALRTLCIDSSSHVVQYFIDIMKKKNIEIDILRTKQNDEDKTRSTFDLACSNNLELAKYFIKSYPNLNFKPEVFSILKRSNNLDLPTIQFFYELYPEITYCNFETKFFINKCLSSMNKDLSGRKSYELVVWMYNTWPDLVIGEFPGSFIQACGVGDIRLAKYLWSYGGSDLASKRPPIIDLSKNKFELVIRVINRDRCDIIMWILTIIPVNRVEELIRRLTNHHHEYIPFVINYYSVNNPALFDGASLPDHQIAYYNNLMMCNSKTKSARKK